MRLVTTPRAIRHYESRVYAVVTAVYLEGVDYALKVPSGSMCFVEEPQREK